MVVESVLALNEEILRGQWDWILACFREVLDESGESSLAGLLPVANQQPPFGCVNPVGALDASLFDRVSAFGDGRAECGRSVSQND